MATNPSPASARGTYKGLPIVAMKMIINKTGDGLSKAVDIDPVVIPIDDEPIVAVRLRKTKDRFDAVREGGTTSGRTIGYTHVQVFDAVGSTFVDDDEVEEKVAATIEAVAVAEAEKKAKGQGAFKVVDGGKAKGAARRRRGAARADLDG